MAYSVITSAEVETGKPVSNPTGEKIVGNFADHESRIDALEVNGSGSNYQVSGSTTASNATGTYADLITLTALVTEGFRVTVGFSTGTLFAVNTTGNVEGMFRVTRNGTSIAEFTLRADTLSGGTNRIHLAASSFSTVDLGLAAGSYVYKLQSKTVNATSVGVTTAIMYAAEG